MRRAAKVDRNHLDIVYALRKAGASVQSLANIGKGCPDLLVGLRNLNFCLEVKDGKLSPSRQRLTFDEATWHGTWHGQVCIVRSIEEAFAVVGLTR